MKHFTIDADNNITLHNSPQQAEAVANAERFSTSAALTKLAEKWPVTRLVEIWNSLPGASRVKKFADRKSAVMRIWKAIQSLGEMPAAEREIPPAEEPEAEFTLAIDAAIPAEFHLAPEVVQTARVKRPEMLITNAESEVERTVETGMAAEPALPVPTTETVADVSALGANVAPQAPTATKKASRAKKTPTGEPSAIGPRENSKTAHVIAMLRREGGAALEEIMVEMGWQKHTTRAMLSAGGSLTKKHALVVTSEKVGDRRMYSIKD